MDFNTSLHHLGKFFIRISNFPNYLSSKSRMYMYIIMKKRVISFYVDRHLIYHIPYELLFTNVTKIMFKWVKLSSTIPIVVLNR